MKIVFLNKSWEDYIYWQETDQKKLKRINDLIKVISRTPYEGAGNPEPLKYEFSGFWSRKIDIVNRLVYRVVETEIQILKCKSHYD